MILGASSQFISGAVLATSRAMKVRHDLESAPVAAEPTGDSPPIPVVIAYRGLSAARWAMRVLDSVANAVGGGSGFRPRLWSFDLLEDPSRRAEAEEDAAQANLLVVATNDAEPLPLTVGDWLAGLLRQKQGSAGAVVALFGPEESPEAAGSTRLEAMRLAVRRAGLEFFAPEAHPPSGRSNGRRETRRPTMQSRPGRPTQLSTTPKRTVPA